jgi:hypothetical protein
MSKLVRSNVYIVPNLYGGIYETSDDPNLMRVTLEQRAVWWKGDKLIKEIRQVEYLTDISVYKKGSILPGNILVAYTTEQITDDWEEHLAYDEQGYILKTPDGFPIYTYFYYDALSKYKVDGLLDADDVLEHLTSPSSI